MFPPNLLEFLHTRGCRSATDATGDGGQRRQDRPAFQDRLIGRAYAGDLDHVIHDREPSKAVIFRPLRLRLYRLECFEGISAVEPRRVVHAEFHGYLAPCSVWLRVYTTLSNAGASDLLPPTGLGPPACPRRRRIVPACG